MNLFKLGTLGLALLGATAFADDCDYVGRHNKADISPVSVKVANVPGHGDIGGFQSLQVLVHNYGNLAIPGVTGLFPAKGLRLGFTVRGAGHRPIRSKQVDGSLNVPMGAGREQWVGYTLPTGYIQNCSTITVTIDYAHTVGQFGCDVYGNDSKSFHVRLQGSPLCATDVIHH